MGSFSREQRTFDRLKHYVGVRLQQGVPIVDEDWNELEDIRKEELRAFLKWFVGDGVPQDTSGFKIESVENRLILSPGDNIINRVIDDEGNITALKILLKIDTGQSSAANILKLSAFNSAYRVAPPFPEIISSSSIDTVTFSEEKNRLVITLEVEEEPRKEFIVDFSPKDQVDNPWTYTLDEIVDNINNVTLDDINASGGDIFDFSIFGEDIISPFSPFHILRDTRCLIDGWEIKNEHSVRYKSQALYGEKGQKLGKNVWKVEPLDYEFPTMDDRVEGIMLDAWEREVTASEDLKHIQHPKLPLPTCVRNKIEWVVRVYDESELSPQILKEDHKYLPLARRVWTWDSNTEAYTVQYQDIRPTISHKPDGTISSFFSIDSETTHHLRQINVSSDSCAKKNCSQVNASMTSEASGSASQVNACEESQAQGEQSQVNASTLSIANGQASQVNACEGSRTEGRQSQVNASIYSLAEEVCSQANASVFSRAVNACSQVNASSAVISKKEFTVCGGFAPYDKNEASEENRTWELSSIGGDIYFKGRLINGMSDYGEYFENAAERKIGNGLLIALDGNKVRPAKKEEDFIGVVSATAGIRLNDSPFCWHGRYMVGKWGEPIYEEIRDPNWKPRKEPDKKWKPKKGETEADRPKIDVETEKDRPFKTVRKQNPDYDPKKTQVPRSERSEEWTLVGLIGQVYVRCDDSVKTGDYIQSNKDGIGTKSENRTRLRAMRISTEYNGSYSIVYCLLI